MPVTEKILYLTFDDGPTPGVTTEILKILKEKKAGATFFCTGNQGNRHPELLQEILMDGHVVGNHTYSHLDGWKTPPGEYAENVHRCSTCFSSGLFRPPYGRFSVSQYFLLRKKFRFILWSVLSGDYIGGRSGEQCLSAVIRHSHPGSIILFHDTMPAKEKVLFALPRVIDHFSERGFTFDAIRIS